MPHRQKPSGAQRSARFELQELQADPPKPQLAVEGLTQLPLLQHPLGQLFALHIPPTHFIPTQLAAQGGVAPQRQTPSFEQLSARFELQALQELPFVPQLANEGVVHDPAQQPLGHEAALQAIGVHVPVAEHC